MVSISGLLLGLIKTIGINIPLSVINLLILFFGVIFSYQFIIHRFHKGFPYSLFLSLYLLIKLFTNLYLYNDLGTDLRDYLLFMIFMGVIQNKWVQKEHARQIIKTIELIMILYGCIFFIQFLFKESLPESLLNIPNIGDSEGIEKYSREYEGIQVYRPNALMGNPISLGFFCNMVVFFGFKLKNKSLREKISLILLPSLLIIMLLSRANITVLFVQLFFGFKIFSKKMLSYLPLIIILLAASSGFLTNFLNIYYLRLSGADSNALASNLEHLNDYLRAYEVFKDNAFFGVSESYIVNNEIITDGTLVILFCKLGSIGASILLLYAVSILKKMGFGSNNRIRDSILLISFLLLLIANSAANNPINLILLAILVNYFLKQNEMSSKNEASLYYRASAIK